MTKKEWKHEWQRWRSFFSLNYYMSLSTEERNHSEINKAGSMAVSIKCGTVRNMAHPAICYALFNRDHSFRVRLITEGKWAMRCNMDLSPFQIEQHRLKKPIDSKHWNKTKLARFSVC